MGRVSRVEGRMSLVCPLLTRIFMTWYRRHPFKNCSKCYCLPLCLLLRLKDAAKRARKARGQGDVPLQIAASSLAPTNFEFCEAVLLAPHTTHNPHSRTPPTYTRTYTERRQWRGQTRWRSLRVAGWRKPKPQGSPSPNRSRRRMPTRPWYVFAYVSLYMRTMLVC